MNGLKPTASDNGKHWIRPDACDISATAKSIRDFPLTQKQTEKLVLSILQNGFDQGFYTAWSRWTPQGERGPLSPYGNPEIDASYQMRELFKAIGNQLEEIARNSRALVEKKKAEEYLGPG